MLDGGLNAVFNSLFLTVSVKCILCFVLTNLTFEIITKLRPADDPTAAYYMVSAVLTILSARAVLIKRINNKALAKIISRRVSTVVRA